MYTGRFALILLLLLSPLAASSQLPAVRGSKGSAPSFYGLTEAQIESRFGKPDDKIVKPDLSTEWNYGKSIFFFAEGKVNAWSDTGELAQREDELSLQKDPVRRDDSLLGEWVNPWTPGKRRSASSNVLDELEH